MDNLYVHFFLLSHVAAEGKGESASWNEGSGSYLLSLANERDKLILNAGMLYELDIESVQ